MGKNQAYKAMQRARHGGSGGGGGGEVDADGNPIAPVPDKGLGVDVSYHTPEWHAARIAALQTERMSWDEFKKKKAEKQALEIDEDKMMREYRAQLDADREQRLARGTNNAHLRAGLDGKVKKKKGKKDKRKKDKRKKDKSRKDKKDKKKKKHKKKHKKQSSDSSSSGSDSDSDSSSSSSDEEVGAGGDDFRMSEFFSGKMG